VNTLRETAEIARLYFEVEKTLKKCMRRDFARFGFTLPQGLVIGALLECGKLKLSELSQKVHLSNSTVSGIVDRLEKQKIVVRERGEKDRRVVFIKVTPEFKEICRDNYNRVVESFAELLDIGTPAELQLITEGLQVLLKILSSNQSAEVKGK